MKFTGDVLLREIDGEIDICYENGQPLMTDGFETAVLLAVFGDRRTWQNALARTPDDRYVSTFPDVIDRATVSEKTKNDGTEALKTALAFLVSSKAASAVTVTGRILSARSIGWEIDIVAPDRSTGSRYLINWEKGTLTAGFRRVA